MQTHLSTFVRSNAHALSHIIHPFSLEQKRCFTDFYNRIYSGVPCCLNLYIHGGSILFFSFLSLVWVCSLFYYYYRNICRNYINSITYLFWLITFIVANENTRIIFDPVGKFKLWLNSTNKDKWSFQIETIMIPLGIPEKIGFKQQRQKKILLTNCAKKFLFFFGLDVEFFLPLLHTEKYLNLNICIKNILSCGKIMLL